jgi:hypothetical protein
MPPKPKEHAEVALLRSPEVLDLGQHNSAVTRIVYDPPTRRLFSEHQYDRANRIFCYYDVSPSDFNQLRSTTALGSCLREFRTRFRSNGVAALHFAVQPKLISPITPASSALAAPTTIAAERSQPPEQPLVQGKRVAHEAPPAVARTAVAASDTHQSSRRRASREHRDNFQNDPTSAVAPLRESSSKTAPFAVAKGKKTGKGPAAPAVPVQAPRRPDYSSVWIEAIDDACRAKAVARLLELQQALLSMARKKQMLPPSSPPPADGAAREATAAAATAGAPQRAPTNMFVVLGSQSNSGSDTDSDSTPVTQPPERGASIPYQSDKSTQCRYMVVMVSDAVAQVLRYEAIGFEKSRDYAACAEKWEEAFGLFNDIILRIDLWYAKYISFEPSSDNRQMEDSHDVNQLEKLFENLHLTRDDTERERNRASERLKGQIARITEKLNPLRNDRDRVKAKWGEERWNNNPAPKLTYAERIVALGKELEEIRNALQRIEALKLNKFLEID